MYIKKKIYVLMLYIYILYTCVCLYQDVLNVLPRGEMITPGVVRNLPTPSFDP